MALLSARFDLSEGEFRLEILIFTAGGFHAGRAATVFCCLKPFGRALAMIVVLILVGVSLYAMFLFVV